MIDECDTDEEEEYDLAGYDSEIDRYTLGDAIRRSYLKHGKDSWCSIAEDVLAELRGVSVVYERTT